MAQECRNGLLIMEEHLTIMDIQLPQIILLMFIWQAEPRVHLGFHPLVLTRLLMEVGLMGMLI